MPSGFTTYNDVTYPFVTQAILTNGHQFSFYQYQLNTMVLHTDHNEAANPLFNECYATPPAELYHEVDSDRVKGMRSYVCRFLMMVRAHMGTFLEGYSFVPISL